jgi:transposase
VWPGASAYSSGTTTRGGHITKCGNAHLPGSAWAYHYRPTLGVELRQRQQGLDPRVVARAWAAQLRLCGRFRRLAARKDSKNVVVTAIAGELAGFLWRSWPPEMLAVHWPPLGSAPR